jgi:hypothetical protein
LQGQRIFGGHIRAPLIADCLPGPLKARQLYSA